MPRVEDLRLIHVTPSVPVKVIKNVVRKSKRPREEAAAEEAENNRTPNKKHISPVKGPSSVIQVQTSIPPSNLESSNSNNSAINVLSRTTDSVSTPSKSLVKKSTPQDTETSSPASSIDECPAAALTNTMRLNRKRSAASKVNKAIQVGQSLRSSSSELSNDSIDDGAIKVLREPTDGVTTPSSSATKKSTPRDTKTGSPVLGKSNKLGSQENPIPIGISSSKSSQKGTDVKGVGRESSVISIDSDDDDVEVKEEQPDIAKLLARMDAQHLKQKSRVTRIFSTLQAENQRLRRSEASYKSFLTDAETSLRTASAEVDSVKNDLLMSIRECSRLEKELLVTKEESSQEKIRAEKAETELEEMKKRVDDLEKLTKEAEERENVAKTRYERVKERVTESVNVITSLLYPDSSKSM